MAGLRGGTVRRRMGCHRGRRSAWRPWRPWSRRRAGGEQRWQVAQRARVATGMVGACCYAAQGSARLGLRRRPSPGFVAGLLVAGREHVNCVVDAKPPGDEVPPATQQRPLKRAGAWRACRSARLTGRCCVAGSIYRPAAWHGHAHRGRRSAWRPWRLRSRRGAGGELRWPMVRQARVATGVAAACCWVAQGSARAGLRHWPSSGFVVGMFAAGWAIIGAGVARGGRGVCGHGAVQVASSAGRWRGKPGRRLAWRSLVATPRKGQLG
jgi:hypothetical protein